MPIAIRDAVPEDEAVVVALWHASGLVAVYNNPHRDFQFALAGAASIVLVAVDGETDGVVGSVMVGHDGHRGWLYYLASAPDERGRSIGRQLVEASEQWLRQRHVAKVQLLVRETNVAVTGFYEHLGYENTPRIVMAKWLDPLS